MDVTFTNEAREIFTVGLRNAHAMEKQALSIMRPQVSRIESYPEVARRLEQHITETENQVDRLERLLKSMDDSSSTFKDAALSVMGTAAALGHSMAGDEIIKDTFANFAFEHYEIAAYISLIELAEAGQMQEAIQLLRQSLAEEEAMASWIKQHIPDVTRKFAKLSESGSRAKI